MADLKQGSKGEAVARLQALLCLAGLNAKPIDGDFGRGVRGRAARHAELRAREDGEAKVDEAHVAAPSSRSKYAVDSETTDTIRGLSRRFDNRLFLSATPHNGHSNSFSALLEILDPVRFTRGVPIEGPEELAPIMVRRLKRDLRHLGVERFPRRLLVQLALEHDGGGWTAGDHPQAHFGADDAVRGG